MKIKQFYFFLLLQMLLFSVDIKAQTVTLECQTFFDKKVDSIYINSIGKEKYIALQDSIKLTIHIVVDSTGRITDSKIKKSRNLTISADTLTHELKKITLPCLYSIFSNSDLYWKGQIVIQFRNNARISKDK